MFRKAVETGLKENTPPEGGKRNNTEVHLTVERVLRDSSRKGVEALRIGVTEETLEKIIEASIENREQGN